MVKFGVADLEAIVEHLRAAGEEVEVDPAYLEPHVPAPTRLLKPGAATGDASTWCDERVCSLPTTHLRNEGSDAVCFRSMRGRL